MTEPNEPRPPFNWAGFILMWGAIIVVVGGTIMSIMTPALVDEGCTTSWDGRSNPTECN